MTYIIDDSKFPVKEDNYFKFVGKSTIAYMKRVVTRKDTSIFEWPAKIGDLILTPGYFGVIALTAPMYNHKEESTLKDQSNLETKVMQKL